MQPCLEGSVRVCISSLTNDDQDHGCQDHGCEDHGCHDQDHEGHDHQGQLFMMSLSILRVVRLWMLGECVVGFANEQLRLSSIDLSSASASSMEAAVPSYVFFVLL